jgi:hypothetical protein
MTGFGDFDLILVMTCTCILCETCPKIMTGVVMLS